MKYLYTILIILAFGCGVSGAETYLVNGDFGHGAHKLVAEITVKAVEDASDPEKFPESAEKYGAWQVKKFYVHMYDQNRIFIDVDVPLESFGGMTARQVAAAGMTKWKNGAEAGKINNIRTGKYHPSDYGLYFSTVGEDVEKNDFLENIPPECLSNYVPPTPSPTPFLKKKRSRKAGVFSGFFPGSGFFSGAAGFGDSTGSGTS